VAAGLGWAAGWAFLGLAGWEGLLPFFLNSFFYSFVVCFKIISK
jgi:hypothetical protein